MFKPQQQYRRCVAETFKVFPPSAVVLIDSLLSLEPEVRGTASSALQSDVSFGSSHKNVFFTSREAEYISITYVVKITL